jgi:polyhydroxyalkanoate synthesis regulator phasin
MIDLIRKTVLAGIGVAVLTAEKVHEVTHRFVEEGKISTEEAEKLADELAKAGERQLDEMSGKMSDTIRKGLDSIELVRRKDFDALLVRVEAIEKKLGIEPPEAPAADVKEEL